MFYLLFNHQTRLVLYVMMVQCFGSCDLLNVHSAVLNQGYILQSGIMHKVLDPDFSCA